MNKIFKSKNVKGLTLSEVLIATFVFLMCSTVVLSTWLFVQKMYRFELGNIDSRRELRAAIHRMNADFKVASFIFDGRTFSYGKDPNGVTIVHRVPAYTDSNPKGQAMAVAIPEVNTKGVLSGKFTLVAYVLTGMKPKDSLNPKAYQLERISRSNVTMTNFNINLQTQLIDTIGTSNGAVTTIIARYIQPAGLDFELFKENQYKGIIKTAAIKVKKEHHDAPPSQQSIESGYSLRNYNK